jgi:hypothetical protein
MRYALLFSFVVITLNAQPDLPGLAVGILDQAKLAQQAVATRDKDAAIGHIRQGLVNADAIRQSAANAPLPLLIPVYTDIETTTTYTPVKHKDGEMSADRLKQDSSIRGVTGDITTRKLDIAAAADRLRTAQASLQTEDWNGAEASLAAVTNCVVVTQSHGNMPLDMAWRNLELARARVLEGKHRDAVVPLNSAAQALGDFEKNCAGEQASAVESARQAMLGAATSISHNHDGALGRIDAWLGSVKQWQTGAAQ